MQIFKDFFSAPPLQKLSTASDIATILGISIATLVAGPFLSDVAGLGFELSEFLWAVFFYAFFATVLLTGSFYLLSNMKKHFSDKKHIWFGVFTFMFLFFISVVFSTSGEMKDFFGGLGNNRYMLPLESQKAVESISVSNISTDKEHTNIDGQLVFKQGVVFSKYLVVAYSVNGSSGELSYMMHGNYKYSAETNANGEFTFLNLNTKNTKEIYLVVYRKADNFQRFPSGLTQLPSSETDIVGAKILRVPLNG